MVMVMCLMVWKVANVGSCSHDGGHTSGSEVGPSVVDMHVLFCVSASGQTSRKLESNSVVL